MPPLHRLLPFAALAAVFAATPAAARAVFDTTPREELAAAEGDAQDQDDQALSDDTTIDDGDIQAFAAAAIDVRKVRMKWLPQMQQAAKQGADAERKTEQQAMQEMAMAVEKNGLSIEKYNAIIDLAQSDPLIQRRIAQEMQQNPQLSQHPGDLDDQDDQDEPDDQAAPDAGQPKTPDGP